MVALAMLVAALAARLDPDQYKNLASYTSVALRIIFEADGPFPREEQETIQTDAEIKFREAHIKLKAYDGSDDHTAILAIETALCGKTDYWGGEINVEAYTFTPHPLTPHLSLRAILWENTAEDLVGGTDWAKKTAKDVIESKTSAFINDWLKAHDTSTSQAQRTTPYAAASIRPKTPPVRVRLGPDVSVVRALPGGSPPFGQPRTPNP